MDISLPVTDGWEATRQLKTDPEDPPYPGDCVDGARDGNRQGKGSRGRLQRLRWS